METLEQLGRQLTGLGELREIVKTMKALSAASVHQYELAVEALADYYRTVELGIHAALRGVGVTAVAELAHRRTQASPGLIVFGSDHGLCGRFNEDVVQHGVDYVAKLPAPVARCRVVAVGARAAGGLERDGFAVEKDLLVPGSATRIVETVQQILPIIENWRDAGDVLPITLVYNHPRRRNTSYLPVSLELVPINLDRFRHLEERPWPSRGIPGFTVDRPTLLTHLLRQYFFVVIHRACAESLAAEHGSRLAAMQVAQRNLDERLGDVTRAFRRARQDAITSELLDVVSGFETIAGSG